MFGWLRAHRRAAYWEKCWREEHEERKAEVKALEERIRKLLEERAKLKGGKP